MAVGRARGISVVLSNQIIADHPHSVARARIRIRGGLARGFIVPPRMTLPEWADEYRKLSRKTSAKEGKWKTSDFEIARGPMLATDEPGVELITLMVATQLLKTSLFENFIGCRSHTDPGPMLVVYPDETAANSFSKERLSTMIEVTPVLKERFGDPLSRRGGNTIEVKHFPGGFVAMAWAGSTMRVAMRPVRYVLLDEVDKYPPTKEGDPMLLAEERASSFDGKEGRAMRLIIRACSPTFEETSRIWASYKNSDMRKPYLQCPSCKHWQTLEFFRHVHWQKRGKHHQIETAAIFCEKCNYSWSEVQRLAAIQNVRWYQTREFICCNEAQDPRANMRWDYVHARRCGYALCKFCGKRAVSNTHAGFGNASKLYSPRISVVQLASKWLDVKDDREARQTFINTQLALPNKIEAHKEASANKIAARAELWDEGREDDRIIVPDPVVVITVGADVHPTSEANVGRIEIETVGWAVDEESWSLDYQSFFGDPAQPEVWNELDEYLTRHFERADGRKMKILAACIDSGGHNTNEVYKFCIARSGRNVWAIKGASDRMGQWSPLWPQHSKRRNNSYRGGYRPVIIGVNAGKEAIRQRLLIDEPGPGYCHFPAGRPPGYFDQLTSERLIIERKGGSAIRKWYKPSHLANEALDVRVYAYAALQGLIHDRGFKPDRVARMLQAPPPAEVELEQEEAPAPQPAPAVPVIPARHAPPAPARPKFVIRRSGFMTMRRY